MHLLFRRARSIALAAALALGFTALAAQPSAAASFVDSRLGEISAEQKATIASPQPVQLIFTFQTAGKANPKGAQFVKAQVMEALDASGAFSQISEGPVDGGAVLSITINNVPEAGAAGKGVGVGLTFGLVGTKVTDHYICTVEYLPPAGGGKISKTVNHAIHTTIGIKEAPPEGVKAKNMKEAVFTMTRQIVGHGVNALALDPAFSGVIQASAPAAPATAESEPQVVPAEVSPAEEPVPVPAEVVAS